MKRDDKCKEPFWLEFSNLNQFIIVYSRFKKIVNNVEKIHANWPKMIMVSFLFSFCDPQLFW